MRGLFSNHHTHIGIRHLVFASICCIIAAFVSYWVRLELAAPSSADIRTGTYPNTFMVVRTYVVWHDLLMITFGAIPALLGGVGYLLLPRMIKADRMAFPKVGNIAFWLLPLSLAYLGFAHLNPFEPSAAAENESWAMYPPLSTTGETVPEVNSVFFALWIAALSFVLCAVNLIATIANMRGPDVKLARMPVLTWLILIAAALFIIVVPIFTALSFAMLTTPSSGVEGFFDPSLGDDPVFFQHLFWFFGHPEVFISFLIMLAWLVCLGVFGRDFFSPSADQHRRNLRPLLCMLLGLAIMIFTLVSANYSVDQHLETMLHDTYFLMPAIHHGLRVAALSFVFALLYRSLLSGNETRNMRIGSYLQIGVFYAGSFLISLTEAKLWLRPPTRYVSAEELSAWGGLDMLMLAGVILMGLGLAAFFLILMEALVRGRPIGNKAPVQADSQDDE